MAIDSEFYCLAQWYETVSLRYSIELFSQSDANNQLV